MEYKYFNCKWKELEGKLNEWAGVGWTIFHAYTNDGDSYDIIMQRAVYVEPPPA